MPFVAAEPKENATLDQAHDLVKQYAAIGLNAVIYANPVGVSPQSGLIAEPDFAANGVPTDGPLYLSLQFPGDATYTDNYTVGLILTALKSGKSLQGALS